MTGTPWKDELERFSGEWLDADDDTMCTHAERLAKLDERSRSHIADLHLIDALLANMAPCLDGEHENRIRRVMDVISYDGPVSRARVHDNRLMSLIPVALCLMVACSLFWFQLSRDSRANDLLWQLGQVSLDKSDRVYNLHRFAIGSDVGQKNIAKLYLRGVEGFVVECGDVVLGRNDHEFWGVAAYHPVVIAESFEWVTEVLSHDERELSLLKELSIESRQLPLMQLSSLIELLRYDYDVTFRRGSSLSQLGLDELVGTRQVAILDGPTAIHLWFDRNSKMIHRVELDWEYRQDNLPAHRLVFELAPEQIVAVDWYRHDAHHEGGRPIRRIGPDHR